MDTDNGSKQHAVQRTAVVLPCTVGSHPWGGGNSSRIFIQQPHRGRMKLRYAIANNDNPTCRKWTMKMISRESRWKSLLLYIVHKVTYDQNTHIFDGIQFFRPVCICIATVGVFRIYENVDLPVCSFRVAMFSCMGFEIPRWQHPIWSQLTDLVVDYSDRNFLKTPYECFTSMWHMTGFLFECWNTEDDNGTQNNTHIHTFMIIFIEGTPENVCIKTTGGFYFWSKFNWKWSFYEVTCHHH